MDIFSPDSSHTRRLRFPGRRTALLAAVATVLATPVAPAWAAGGGPSGNPHHGPHGEIDVNTCPDTVAPGTATCFARHRIDQGAKAAKPTPAPGAKVAGPAAPPPAAPNELVGGNGAYGPLYLQSAYNAPSANPGTTVAIVDAYDNSRAESDLAYYRSYFGLPPCTTANGCFRKVDQRGGTTYPQGDQSWGQEIALDLDMVSAICPNCRLLLVEADSNSITDLGAAVNEAVALGASVVSNSWGSQEYQAETLYSDLYFNHPGVAVVASSGDNGFGMAFPAASQYVTAVGGTTLYQATATGSRDATETAWVGAGSGCSRFVPKPSWQHDTGCGMRTITDVSAVADTATGVWVWNTYPYGGGWGIFGGTSVAAPIISAMYALAGNPSGLSSQLASAPYGHPSALNDITSGLNGYCASLYLCTGVVGYDGPTGLGTPNGVGAFVASASPPAPQPPSAPTDLTAVFGHSVDLAWSAAAGTVASYVVERDGVEIGRTANTWYYDTNDVPGATYTYDVRTLDSAGNLSAPSNFVTLTVPLDTSPPKAPSSVKVAVAGNSQVALYWTPSTDNIGVVGYDVYRDGVQVASTGAPNYLDSGLAPRSSHVYKVAARDAVGNTSLFSSSVRSTTAALSTATTGTLSGVVYSSLGRPVANAIVRLTVNGVVKSAKTGTSGAYSLTRLPPGTYELTITPPTGVTASVQTVSDATAVAGQLIVLVTSF